jgi:lactoylglutathione lyase/glyoxylase I family protein
MITGLAHVCFVVSDLDASITFYRDKLGLRPAFDFINDKGERFGIYFRLGHRTFLELFRGEVGKPAERPSFQHFCLEVEDIEATVAQMKANGVAVGEVTLGSDNSWQAWLNDPDGNRIELHAYTPESKQVKAMG